MDASPGGSPATKDAISDGDPAAMAASCGSDPATIDATCPDVKATDATSDGDPATIDTTSAGVTAAMDATSDVGPAAMKASLDGDPAIMDTTSASEPPTVDARSARDCAADLASVNIKSAGEPAAGDHIAVRDTDNFTCKHPRDDKGHNADSSSAAAACWTRANTISVGCQTSSPETAKVGTQTDSIVSPCVSFNGCISSEPAGYPA